MNNETFQNMQFLKETIGKFKDEMQKFISDPQYVANNVFKLRNGLENLEKGIIQKEKFFANKALSNQANMHTTIMKPLPDINFNTYYAKNKEIPKKSQSAVLKFPHESEQNVFKETIMKRKHMETTHRSDAINKKHEFSNSLKKNNIITNPLERITTKKRSVGTVNYMDKGLISKYSVSHRMAAANKTVYDENNRPKITKEEVDKGMLNMIYKGLIPKYADLTPGFHRGGNPIKTSTNMKDLYGKRDIRDEIDSDSMANIKYNFDQMSNVNNVNNINNLNVVPAIQKGPNFFLTDKIDKLDKIDKQSSRTLKVKKEEVLEQIDNENRDNSLISEFHNINDGLNQSQEKRMFKIINIILFSNFQLVKNDEFKTFYLKNEDKWGVINYIIEHLQKLFKSLNILLGEVDAAKILQLANDELKVITNKDLIGCLSDKFLEKNGFDNPNTVFARLRDHLIITIQNGFRAFLARRKYKKQKFVMMKLEKIQKTFRLHLLYERTKRLRNENFLRNYEKFKTIKNSFKKNWKTIKANARYEIHINSISYHSMKNATIEKFSEKQNNQLSRFISLADPNVQIIYISPYPLGKEILSYYYSILTAIGIENPLERIHILVPDMVNKLSANFSLAKLLFCSSKTLKVIRSLIDGKNAYIVPGTPDKIDIQVAMFLNCPILMDDFEYMNIIFNKSGSKRIFELTGMALPISAWDIKTQDEFYRSLCKLIRNYTTINIWIFKIDHEFNGRGTAYLNLEKIKAFADLKRERMYGLDDEKFEAQLKMLIKSTIPKIIEIITPRLYNSWDDFIEAFCESGGVIEACPTNTLNGVFGSPCISMLIEPDGNLELISTYDKVNYNNFRNIFGVSPQKSIPNLNVNMVMERIGKYLYENGVIGYCTIELICFYESQKILFWAIDLKFGLTDYIASFKLCEFLYTQSKNNHSRSLSILNSSLNLDFREKDQFSFVFPHLIDSNIANVKMKELVHLFRTDILIFDLERKSGIVFLLPDILQCGLMGLCGVGASQRECNKLIDDSLKIIKAQIEKNEGYNNTLADYRTDIVPIYDLMSRARLFLKHLAKFS